MECCDVKGPLLLAKFVNDILMIQTPMICCTSFILSELFNVSLINFFLIN